MIKIKPVILLIILSVIFFTSCNSNKTNSTSDNKESEERKAESKVVNCYQYTGKSDTILLKVVHVDEAITGTLVYNLEGKDKNKGTVQGSMQGDIFVAKYTFTSEGIQSVRQVAFKLKGNTFVEGYGETEDRKGEVYFKDLSKLSFNDSMKLIEVPCQ